MEKEQVDFTQTINRTHLTKPQKEIAQIIAAKAASYSSKEICISFETINGWMYQKKSDPQMIEFLEPVILELYRMHYDSGTDDKKSGSIFKEVEMDQDKKCVFVTM